MSAQPIPPPMAAPRNYTPTPTDRFFTPVTRSRWVVGLLGVGVLLDIVGVGFDSATLSLVRTAQAGELVDQDAADLIDMGNGLAALANTAAYLATAVLFCCWLYRVVKNTHLLTEENGPAPGMAAASFFIPFYNLWGPFMAVKFAWNASGKLAYAEESARPGMLVLGAWWATWIAGNVVGRIVLQQTIKSWGVQPTLDQLAQQSIANIAMGVLNVVCAVFCIMLTMKLTGMQRKIESDMNDAAISLQSA